MRFFCVTSIDHVYDLDVRELKLNISIQMCLRSEDDLNQINILKYHKKELERNVKTRFCV